MSKENDILNFDALDETADSKLVTKDLAAEIPADLDRKIDITDDLAAALDRELEASEKTAVSVEEAAEKELADEIEIEEINLDEIEVKEIEVEEIQVEEPEMEVAEEKEEIQEAEEAEETDSVEEVDVEELKEIEEPEEIEEIVEEEPEEIEDEESGKKKKKKNKKDKSKKGRKKAEEEEEDDFGDFEFITLESVKDLSMMPEYEKGSDKKATRRSNDKENLKKEKKASNLKKAIPVIIIIIAAAIVAALFGGKYIKEYFDKKKAENKEQPVTEQEYEVDEYKEINDLINNYYSCYRDGDTETIINYAYPMTDTEATYIEMYSQYVEAYQNVTCYTKAMDDGKSYIVSTAVDIKFKGVETSAPGLGFFYVVFDEGGKCHIDNTYSSFNLSNRENPLDANIEAEINKYIESDDCISLQASVQTRYDEAVAKDAALATMMNETIPAAEQDWMTNLDELKRQKLEQAQAQVDADNQQLQSTIANTRYTNDKVNVRKDASTDAEKLGTLDAGASVQLVEDLGEWSHITTDSLDGYVKTEFLATEPAAAPTEEAPAETTKANGTVRRADGTVYLGEAVNVRKSMSESADKIGTALPGESLKIVMDYAEGWTKVEWNGQTGYVKTELIK